MFTERIGKSMSIAAWVLALGLLTWLFSGILDHRANPNGEVQGVIAADGSRQVVLRRNRAGHYVANGAINDQPVEFLVDTGASDVAVPESVARRLGLQRGGARVSRTAAGDVMTWSSLLRSVDIGGIRLHTIRASILPDMAGDQVLLGMSFLKRLELVQRGDTLTLRLP